MKKRITILLLAIFTTIGAFAQDGPHAEKRKYPGPDEILSQKIAFFTQELDLTPEEAQNSGRYIMQDGKGVSRQERRSAKP